jgi:aromatic-amino-acid transaminase
MIQSQRSPFLIPALLSRSGDDPIFALNAEASERARRGESILNATLGALMDDSGRLVTMPVVIEVLRRVDAVRAAAYAPIAGEARFLTAVAADVFGNTTAASHAMAVATPGGTGALNLAAQCFLEPGQALLTSHFFWGPYETIAAHTGRRIETFPTFDARGRFDVTAFGDALQALVRRQGRALVFLNTPCHNPTGYSLDAAELAGVSKALRAAAALGPVTLMLDIAYAHFEPAGGPPWRQTLADLAGEVGVLVAWSASKSFAQYGARIGAMVAVHPDEAERARLRGALSYACRGTWSNCNHAGMLAVGELLTDASARTRLEHERQTAVQLLAERVLAFNLEAQRAGLRYPRYEGGFFVTVFCPQAELAARHLRAEGVYVVPIESSPRGEGALRVALCSTPARDVPRLVGALSRAMDALRSNAGVPSSGRRP